MRICKGKTWLNCLIAIAITSAASAVSADTYSVKFRVTNSDGETVAGADLATRWITDEANRFVENPKPGPQPFFNKTKTDNSGVAELVFEDRASQVLFCFSQDRKLAGFVIVEQQDEGNTIDIELTPTVRFTADYVCSETDSVPDWTNLIISHKDARGYFFEYRSMNGKVEFPFPRGDWKLRIYGSNIKGIRQDIHVKPDEDFELGTIDFEPTNMAKLIGKPAPQLSILDARGTSKEIQLSDYKGKWVLLEFWGHW